MVNAARQDGVDPLSRLSSTFSRRLRPRIFTLLPPRHLSRTPLKLCGRVKLPEHNGGFWKVQLAQHQHRSEPVRIKLQCSTTGWRRNLQHFAAIAAATSWRALWLCSAIATSASRRSLWFYSAVAVTTSRRTFRHFAIATTTTTIRRPLRCLTITAPAGWRPIWLYSTAASTAGWWTIRYVESLPLRRL